PCPPCRGRGRYDRARTTRRGRSRYRPSRAPRRPGMPRRASLRRRAGWSDGPPSGRSSGERSSCAAFALGPQHDLDAAVLLVPEDVVHRRTVLERRGMGDHERGVDLAILDAAEEIVAPAMDMRLAHA